MNQRYQSGEEIHIGDSVKYNECPAAIVFVIDREEWPDEESHEGRKWWRSEYSSGFLLLQKDGNRFFMEDADEDLIFVSRKAT